MLAVLSPGQGSQKPGFLTPWLDLDGSAARLTWWSAFTGTDLLHLGTQADTEEIKDTARTQPLLVAGARGPPSRVGLGAVEGAPGSEEAGLLGSLAG